MMSFAAVYVSLALLFHRSSVEAKCEKPGLHFLGDEVKIICGIQGTYSWPGWNKWKKGVTRITNDGSPLINPDYAARCSYDTDNKTLIITNVMKSDEGQYACAKAEKEDSPQTFELIVKEPNNAHGIKDAVVALFILTIVVLAVVIIRQSYMIRIYNEVKRTEKNSKVSSIVILIIAAVLFIIVLAWFIVIQETKEDCEKLTKKDNYFSLLAVEIIVFVLGSIILVYQFIRKSTTPDSPTLGHKTSGDEQISEEPQLPVDRSEEGFKRLSYVTNTIRQIFRSAFPGYVPGNYFARYLLFEDHFSRCDCLSRYQDIEEYYSHEQLQRLGQIINVVEDIIEQKLEERKTDDSVSPQHLEPGKIDLLRTRVDQFLCKGYGCDKIYSENVRVYFFVEDVIIGHHLMKLTRAISTPYGCVSNISKTGPGLFRSSLGKPNTPVFYSSKHIPEEQQLLDNWSDKGFGLLSFVRRSIQRIFEYAVSDSLTEEYRNRFSWYQSLSARQLEILAVEFIENRLKDYRNGHWQHLGQIINAVEDIIEQMLEKRKRDNSVSPQHWEPGKIDLLRAKIDQFLRDEDSDKKICEYFWICFFVEKVITGHHLMKLTMSTPDGCVSNNRSLCVRPSFTHWWRS